MNSLRFNPNNDNDGDIPYLPEIPEDAMEEVASKSTEQIHIRLHERTGNIEKLTTSEQGLREFSGILNPKEDTETKIESL